MCTCAAPACDRRLLFNTAAVCISAKNYYMQSPQHPHSLHRDRLSQNPQDLRIQKTLAVSTASQYVQATGRRQARGERTQWRRCPPAPKHKSKQAVCSSLGRSKPRPAYCTWPQANATKSRLPAAAAYAHQQVQCGSVCNKGHV